MKKGFTLIELLAVLIILGVIAVIAVPIVINSLNEANNNSYKITLKNIEKIASYYVTENPGIGNNQNTFDIELETLCEEKYIDCPVYNQNTDEEISGYVRVTKTENNKYIYKFIEE